MWIIIITILILFFCLPIRVKINIINNNYIIKVYIFSNIIIINKNYNNYINKLKDFNINKLRVKNNRKNSSKTKYIVKFILQILKKIKIEKFQIEYLNILKCLNYNYLLAGYLITIMNSCIYSCLSFKNTNIENISIKLPFESHNNNKFKFNCIIGIKPANIIYIIFRIIIESGVKYVRTSYRKFNDNCNEIFRKYD